MDICAIAAWNTRTPLAPSAALVEEWQSVQEYMNACNGMSIGTHSDETIITLRFTDYRGAGKLFAILSDLMPDTPNDRT